MNKSMKNQQSFGFFTNLNQNYRNQNNRNQNIRNRNNNQQLYSLDPKSILKKFLIQTVVCLIIFFVVISMKNINTEATNKMTEEISYRINQEFDYKGSYHTAVNWGKNMLLKGESTLAAINFGEYNQRSFVMPMEGSIVANFNDVESDNGKPLKGIVIEGIGEDEVVAADDGVVIEVNASQGLGHYIVIKHRGEYISVYKHLQASHVEVNSKVVRGEAIGTASSKLLFEVYQRKEAIDPLQFLNTEEISL